MACHICLPTLCLAMFPLTSNAISSILCTTMPPRLTSRPLCCRMPKVQDKGFALHVIGQGAIQDTSDGLEQTELTAEQKTRGGLAPRSPLSTLLILLKPRRVLSERRFAISSLRSIMRKPAVARVLCPPHLRSAMRSTQLRPRRKSQTPLFQST